MKYEPALDGLRAFAVIVVVVYHVSSRLLPGGWIGVDIFFVLSGFLITSILDREIEASGTIDFGKFYMRRVLRLTPAFWFVLLCTSLAAVIFSTSSRSEEIRAVIVSSLYMTNWWRAFNVSPQGPLGHTWSLAMEEQFYLLWPAVLMFIRRRNPIAWTSAAVVALTSWRVYLALSGADPERTYNGFDTHGDALLIGCLLALLPVSAQSFARSRLPVVVPILAMVIMLCSAALPLLSVQTFGLTVASALSAWLIVGAFHPGWFRRLLSSRPLVYTGRISYGWYLWHYPLLYFGQKFPFLQSGQCRIILVLIAYPIAACSHRVIEQPFLRLKCHFEPNERPRREPAVSSNGQRRSRATRVA